jgi:hypothetical protein
MDTHDKAQSYALLKHLGYVGPQMTESYAQNDPYGTCVQDWGRKHAQQDCYQ